LLRVIDPTYDYIDASFDDFGLNLVEALGGATAWV
jgi:hypothetical protein